MAWAAKPRGREDVENGKLRCTSVEEGFEEEFGRRIGIFAYRKAQYCAVRWILGKCLAQVHKVTRMRTLMIFVVAKR